MTATTPRPVVLLGDPDRRTVPHLIRLSDLARQAIADQRAPIVLHPHFLPWLYEDTGWRNKLAPYASQVARGIVEPMAARSNAELWIITDEPSPWTPAWAKGAVRVWVNTRRLSSRESGGANVRNFPLTPSLEVAHGAV